MTYSIVELECIDKNDWIAYVTSNENGSFFHTPTFLDAIETQIGYKAIALCAINESGEIEALLTGYQQVVKQGLLSALSIRIVVPQLPLYNDERSLAALLQAFTARIGKNAVYSEFRAQVPDQVFRKVAQGVGMSYVPHYNVINDCSDVEESSKIISESKRRQIKKALKSGVTIEESPSLAQVHAYYDILHYLYINKVQKPLVTRSYFEYLYNNNKGNDDFCTKFLLVIFEDKVIGGIVAPVSEKKTIHEHYVAGLDQEYKNQYPSVMATWAAIDYASRNEIACFDFMGAGIPDEDYGVRDFKLKFGGELIEAGRYEYVPKRLKYTIATKGFELYRKLQHFRSKIRNI